MTREELEKAKSYLDERKIDLLNEVSNLIILENKAIKQIKKKIFKKYTLPIIIIVTLTMLVEGLLLYNIIYTLLVKIPLTLGTIITLPIEGLLMVSLAKANISFAISLNHDRKKEKENIDYDKDLKEIREKEIKGNELLKSIDKLKINVLNMINNYNQGVILDDTEIREIIKEKDNSRSLKKIK